MFVTLRMGSRRASVAAMIAAASLLLPISPAWADGSGVTTNGFSNINETGDPTDVPLCLQADNLEITLYSEGSFNDQAGPYDTEAFFESPGTIFYFGPAGTFSDPSCTTAAPVSGTLTVSGDVTCTDKVNATYQRVSGEYVIETTVAPTCTVAGTSETSHLKFTGEQLACGGPVDPCDPQGTPSDTDNVEFTGVYVQG